MTNLNLKLLAKLIVILLVALGLKTHYSYASENELRWILAPTTLIVELVTGVSFTFEPHAGYMSSGNRFLIAASCSGVNFLIIGFLLLTLGPLWRERTVEWRSIPFAMAVAFGVTLVANTTRIVVAMAFQNAEFAIAGLTPDQTHRIEGIIVYFVFLLLLLFSTERKPEGSRASSFTYLLGIYYAVTIGIPLVRGSFLEYASFWQHSLFVLILPLVIVLPFAVFHIIQMDARKLRRRQT